MKYLVLLLFLVGCASCPPQDVYFLVTDSDGSPQIIEMDEGYLDVRDNWKSEDEVIEHFRQRNELIND